MNKRGYVTLLAIVFMSILLTLTAILTSNIIRAHSKSGNDYLKAKAFHIAEGGLHMVLRELSCSPAYIGSKETALGEGAFKIEILSLKEEPHKKIIISTGYTFNERSPQVKIEALVHLKAISLGKFSVVMQDWKVVK